MGIWSEDFDSEEEMEEYKMTAEGQHELHGFDYSEFDEPEYDEEDYMEEE